MFNADIKYKYIINCSIFPVLLGLIGKTFFGVFRDIHFYLLSATALHSISPIALEGDWRGSTLVPGATNWHISLVCCKPPTRHTCYMYVAKNGISAPLLHSVNTAERPSVYLCLHPPTPTRTECNTHLQITNVHACLNTHAHAQKPIQTDAQTLTDIAGHLKIDRCWHTDAQRSTHAQRQGNRQSVVHTFTITPIPAGRLCSIVLGA